MQPIGVHHVSVNVDDVEAALAFYTEILGFTVRDDRPDFGFGGAWLNVGDQQLHLLGAGAPPNLGQHFAVHVEDIAATIAEIRSKGVEVSDASDVGPGQQAFLNDPAGNFIEIYQLGNAVPA